MIAGLFEKIEEVLPGDVFENDGEMGVGLEDAME